MKLIQLKMIRLGYSGNLSEMMHYVFDLNLKLFDYGKEIFIEEQNKYVSNEQYNYVIEELNNLADELKVEQSKIYEVKDV